MNPKITNHPKDILELPYHWKDPKTGNVYRFRTMEAAMDYAQKKAKERR